MSFIHIKIILWLFRRKSSVCVYIFLCVYGLGCVVPTSIKTLFMTLYYIPRNHSMQMLNGQNILFHDT